MNLPQTKLTDKDVESIRKIYVHINNITQKEIADLFHTTQPHISRIVRGLRRVITAKVAE